MSTDLPQLLERIAAGSDPDERDAHGRTALHLAIAAKDVEAVRLLLDRGADWEVRDHDGVDPTQGMYTETRKPWGIDFQLRRGFKPILALLQEAVLATPRSLTFLNKGLLFNAILEKRVASVEAALDDGGVWDLGVRLDDGSTPLHLAVEMGNARVVKALLAHTKTIEIGGRLRCYPGPDLAACNQAGETALDVARRCGDPVVIELLEAHAARDTEAVSDTSDDLDPVDQVIARLGEVLGEAHALEDLALPVPGLTLIADELSCMGVVVVEGDPWTAPFAGRTVPGRLITEQQVCELADATGQDELSCFGQLLDDVTTRLRREGAPFLAAGATVVWVEHGALLPVGAPDARG